MKKSILQECLRDARMRLKKHPQFLHYPHFSYLIKDNQICSIGMNRQHEPDKKYGYHNRIPKDDFRPKWHSEIDAILKTHRYLKDGFVCVNIRLNKTEETRMACPCSICFKLLLMSNCKMCYFSTLNDEWGKIKF